MRSLEKFKLARPEVIKGGTGTEGGGNDGDRWGTVGSEANLNG